MLFFWWLVDMLQMGPKKLHILHWVRNRFYIGEGMIYLFCRISIWSLILVTPRARSSSFGFGGKAAFSPLDWRNWCMGKRGICVTGGNMNKCKLLFKAPRFLWLPQVWLRLENGKEKNGGNKTWIKPAPTLGPFCLSARKNTKAPCLLFRDPPFPCGIWRPLHPSSVSNSLRRLTFPFFF